MRRAGIELGETFRGCDSLAQYPLAISLLTVVRRKCAGRELNPGYELGKLMSYH